MKPSNPPTNTPAGSGRLLPLVRRRPRISKSARDSIDWLCEQVSYLAENIEGSKGKGTKLHAMLTRVDAIQKQFCQPNIVEQKQK